MNIEELRDYCLSKPGVTEDLPFGEDTLVFKVGGRIFALTNIENFNSINLKCDPVLALELRDKYLDVIPGYHMNKKHWNTIAVNQKVPDPMIYQWIDHSYELVYERLPGKIKDNL